MVRTNGAPVQQKVKKYSPVRVVNPVGDNHIVPLNPNQGFIVVISQWSVFKEFDYHSDYFTFREKEQLRDGTTILRFTPKYDLTQWAKMGSVYLGEVVVLSESVAASLCVVLSSKHTDVFTVVNPCGAEAKVHPHDILEVVVYDAAFHGKWDCKVTPGEQGVQYQQIGYESIMTSIGVKSLVNRMKTSNSFVVFPRSLEGFDGKEHHYWFEYDVLSKTKIAEWATDTYSGGCLIFEPSIAYGGSPSPSVLHVQLAVRRKNRNKLQCPKRLPDSLPFDIALPVVGRAGARQAFGSGVYDSYQVQGHQSYRRQNNAASTYYNDSARPFQTVITIKERVVAVTADPLYVGTSIIDPSSQGGV